MISIYTYSFIYFSFTELTGLSKFLANINRRLSHIEDTQKEILRKLPPDALNTVIVNSPPTSLRIPCDNIEDINHLEEWLQTEENVKTMVSSQ